MSGSGEISFSVPMDQVSGDVLRELFGAGPCEGCGQPVAWARDETRGPYVLVDLSDERMGQHHTPELCHRP